MANSELTSSHLKFTTDGTELACQISASANRLDLLGAAGSDIILNGIDSPVLDNDAANKTYVDDSISSISSSNIWKTPVNMNSITNVVLTSLYDGNVELGGVTVSTGDRVLLTGQTDPVENGIYVIRAATNVPLRGGDYALLNNVGGTVIFSINTKSFWLCTNVFGSDIVGTDSLTFIEINNDIPIEISALGSSTIATHLVDPVQFEIIDNTIIAKLSSVNDLKIINVTIPSSPTFVGTLSLTNGTPTTSFMFTVAGNNIYTCTDTTFEIFKFVGPTTIISVGSLGAQSFSTTNNVGHSSMIYSNGFVFGHGPNGILIFDVRDPSNPILDSELVSASIDVSGRMGLYASGQTLYCVTNENFVTINMGSTFTIVGTLGDSAGELLLPHSLVVRGSMAYILAENYFFSVDVENRSSPALLNTLIDLTFEGGTVILSGNYALIGSTSGGKVVDITDPSSLANTTSVLIGDSDSVTSMVLRGETLFAGTTGGTSTIYVQKIKTLASSIRGGSLAIGGDGTINQKLNVVGDVSFNSSLIVGGNTSVLGDHQAREYSSTSDLRLKINLELIENGLDYINKIRPYSFNWRKNPTGIKQLGVVAQNLENVGLENLVKRDEEGFRSVNYDSLIPLLISSIQKLSERVLYLESKFS